MNNYNKYSANTNQILKKPLHWIVIWGNSIIFFFAIIIILFTWFIKYPELIASKIEVTTETPPIHIKTIIAGRIDSILVHDKSFINEGSNIAVIENNANFSDVMKLKDKINIINHNIDSNLNEINSLYYDNLKLGEIQDIYSEFIQSFINYYFFIRSDFQNENISYLIKQIDLQIDLNKCLIEDKNIKVKELSISNEKYIDSKGLFTKGLISVEELRKIESELLEKENLIVNSESQILRNKLQSIEYEKNILNLKRESELLKLTYLQNLKESLKKIR